MEQDNREVIRSFFDAFNAGDLDRAESMVSDDFELLDAAVSQVFHGRHGCRQWLASFRTALPDAHAELGNVLAEGSLVAAEHVGRGTQDGPFWTPAGTIPPTGRRIELRIGEFFEVRDGKIARLTAYYDGATMMRQLGLLPPQGSVRERGMTAAMGLAVRARRALRRG